MQPTAVSEEMTAGVCDVCSVPLRHLKSGPGSKTYGYVSYDVDVGVVVKPGTEQG